MNDKHDGQQPRPLEEIAAHIDEIDRQIDELNRVKTDLLIEHDEAAASVPIVI